MKVLITQSSLTLCDLMDSGPRGSSVHGILQEENTGAPFLSPGDLPNPGIEFRSPEFALQANSLRSSLKSYQ